ncbi:MAG: hypothetical protein WCX73_01210 [Candidatus Pacearchaeota archaeon]|jgi:hypothetical protein
MIDKKAQLKIQVHKNHRFLVPKSSKAQLKIQEMAFFLVAVLLFFILVGLFAFSIYFAHLTKSANAVSEERTLSSITNLADAAEFNCGEPNCIDADKVIGLMQNVKYEKFWSFSSLKILRSSGFPMNKDESKWITCTPTNYPDCDVFEIYDKNVKNERTISNYVALCRVELENGENYKRCEIAKVIAGTEIEIAGE